MNALTLVFAGFAGLGGLGGFVALFLVRSNRKKIDAEARLLGVKADDVLSGRALEMYDRAIKAAESADSRAARCNEKVDALERHVGKLEREMRAAGMTPEPFVWPLYQVGGST